MKKIIEISGVPTEFESTATTDYLVEGVFGLRVNQVLKSLEKEENEEAYPDFVRKLAFIMAKKAELKSWRKVLELTKDDFYDWLDQIDSYAIESEETAKEILALYVSNKKNKVIPKNAASPQAES